MGALVVLQILELCVCFPALVTGIRPMTLVVPSVLPEHGGISKTLPALCTEIWLFSCVRAHVHLQFGQGGIALRALRARVRTLPAVLCHMDPQAYSLHEGLPTVSAYERFLPRVRAAVVAELRGRLVSLVAVGTLKGALG